MFIIRLFPEGGNYGNEEAVNTINTLNDLGETMLEEKTEIVDSLENGSFKSVFEVKETFSKIIAP